MTVIPLKGFSKVPRSAGVVKSRMDTILLTRAAAEALVLPPFQRPLKVNRKVEEIAEKMKENGGIIDGVMTLGDLGLKRYLVDGQHRREAFLMSELPEAYVDVRICEFDTMAEMAEEFVKLNSQIVRLTADDMLRGLEQSNDWLRLIRKDCPFVGYGYLGANPHSPILSMSVLLKSWSGSKSDVPSIRGGIATHIIASDLTEENARNIASFLKIAYAAWGQDKQNMRLWGRINLMLCLWLWHRLVLAPPGGKTVRLTHDQFKKGLMALSADGNFIDWLQGRWSERDRAPAYARIKALFADRLKAELGHKIMLPAPDWSNP